MRRIRVFAYLVCLTTAGCGGGSSTSSGGPTRFAGSYDGTVTVAGLGNRPLTITISVDGKIDFDVVGGGIVCSGDIPDDLELDGDAFDATDSGECLVNAFACPTTTIITGAISGNAITGSGQVVVGCPGGFDTFDFVFIAR